MNNILYNKNFLYIGTQERADFYNKLKKNKREELHSIWKKTMFNSVYILKAIRTIMLN